MIARRVLVAADGSDHSMRALEYARGLVHDHAIKVAVIHVVSPTGTHPASLDDDAEPEDPQRRGGRLLSEACHILGLEESEVEQFLRTGDPVEQIVLAATGFRADLIVMGSRGRSGWKGSPVGSVSQAVLADAPCSLLVVKEQIDNRYGVG